MLPWERRLRDLSKILNNCGDTYFSPDLFCQNINQFLQTSRTVTFIIQKNKATIPGFDSWYSKHILVPWKDDVVMTWAKDARNYVEKEGDLDMYSRLNSKVIFSHLESDDIPIELAKDTLLHADIKRVEKLVKANLPRGIAYAAALKVERRWVAKTLPEHELVWALTYVYASIYRVCEALALHLGGKLDDSLPHPTDLDPVSNDVAQSRFIKLGEPGMHRMKTSRIYRDKKFEPPDGLVKISIELKKMAAPNSLRTLIERVALTAEFMFDHNGGHFPMLCLYDDDWKQIDSMSTVFRDQTDKFLFWRMASDRAAYLRAGAFIWVSEVWIRDLRGSAMIPMHERRIIGEQMHVVGGTADGKLERAEWDILRPNGETNRQLKAIVMSASKEASTRMFFAEVMTNAMRSVRNPSKAAVAV
jgi:hypothetical protein